MLLSFWSSVNMILLIRCRFFLIFPSFFIIISSSILKSGIFMSILRFALPSPPWLFNIFGRLRFLLVILNIWLLSVLHFVGILLSRLYLRLSLVVLLLFRVNRSFLRTVWSSTRSHSLDLYFKSEGDSSYIAYAIKFYHHFINMTISLPPHA